MKEGETVEVGTPVARIAEAGEATTTGSPADGPSSNAEAVAPVEKMADAPGGHFRTHPPKSPLPRKRR